MLKNSNKWFRYEGNQLTAEKNIFCFPQAGSSASFFAKWKSLSDEKVCIFPVQYPGRENRRKEVMPESLVELAGAFVEDNYELLQSKPYILFGNCMGSIICWEIVKELERRGGKLPKVLVVSASTPPTERMLSNVEGLNDSEIIEQLCEMGYVNQSLIAEKEYFDYYMSIMKKDKRAMELYDYAGQKGQKVSCPIVSFNGKYDDEVLNQQALEWEDFTENKFRRVMFEGGHFYLSEDTKGTIECLERYLEIN